MMLDKNGYEVEVKFDGNIGKGKSSKKQEVFYILKIDLNILKKAKREAAISMLEILKSQRDIYDRYQHPIKSNNTFLQGI